MDIEKQHQHFTQELSKRLSSLQQTMITSLKELFTGNYILLQDGYSTLAIESFYFEYMYDSLDIMVWAQDIQDDIISIGAKRMLSDIQDSIFSKELESAFYNLEEQWGDTEEGQDAFDELAIRLDQTKDELLTKWFTICWSIAKKESASNVKGFFSIHDTIYRTSLP